MIEKNHDPDLLVDYLRAKLLKTENPRRVLLLTALGFSLITIGAFIVVSDLTIWIGGNEIEIYAAVGLLLFGCLGVAVGLLSHRSG